MRKKIKTLLFVFIALISLTGCSKCSQTQENTCTECKDGYYLTNGECKLCTSRDSNCLILFNVSLLSIKFLHIIHNKYIIFFDDLQLLFYFSLWYNIFTLIVGGEFYEIYFY